MRQRCHLPGRHSLPLHRLSAQRPLLITALVLLTCCSDAGAQSTTRTLAPGVVFTQEITQGPAPLVINALRIDLSVPGVRMQTGQANDVISLAGPTKGRETIHSLAARHNALAAVNADFFPFTGDPLGISIRDGELLSESSANRACLSIGPNGVLLNILSSVGTLTLSDAATLNLTGINRVPHDGDAVVLTPTYTASPGVDKNGVVLALRDVNLPVKLSQTVTGVVDSITPIGSGEQIAQISGHTVQIVVLGASAGALAAHSKQGDSVQFRFDVVPAALSPGRSVYASRAGGVRPAGTTPLWANVQQAVGGGPFLVRDGQIAVDGLAEGFGKADFIAKRHPRTAAGVDAKGHLLLVTVDGRSPLSQGASLDELAAIMKRLGAVQALNFDGGGSTTMTVSGGVVNAPSDGRARPVADGLLVYADTPVSSPLPDGVLHIVPLPAPEPDAVSTRQLTTNSANDSADNNSDISTVRAGAPLRFQIVDDKGKPVRGLNAVWGTGDGFGFISQDGVFTCFHAGSGTISANCGGRQARAKVQVTAGPPFRVDARLNALALASPERNMLTVTVLDRYGNPVAGQRVTLDAPGSDLQIPLITNKKGIANSILVWNLPPARRLLTAIAGAARSVPVRGDIIFPPAPPLKEPIDPDDRP